MNTAAWTEYLDAVRAVTALPAAIDQRLGEVETERAAAGMALDLHLETQRQRAADWVQGASQAEHATRQRLAGAGLHLPRTEPADPRLSGVTPMRLAAELQGSMAQLDHALSQLESSRRVAARAWTREQAEAAERDRLVRQRGAELAAQRDGERRRRLLLVSTVAVLVVMLVVVVMVIAN